MAEEKDPFKEFIENLEAINHLPKEDIPIRDLDWEYIEKLIVRYALPQDETCKQALVSMRKQAMFISRARFIPMLLKQYIVAMLWDLAVNTKKPLDAVYASFLLGMAAGELIEWEDIGEPPQD